MSLVNKKQKSLNTLTIFIFDHNAWGTCLRKVVSEVVWALWSCAMWPFIRKEHKSQLSKHVISLGHNEFSLRLTEPYSALHHCCYPSCELFHAVAEKEGKQAKKECLWRTLWSCVEDVPFFILIRLTSSKLLFSGRRAYTPQKHTISL